MVSGDDDSTVDQLLLLTSKVRIAFDQRRSCDAVFLDFSKAFDKVSHSLILHAVSSFCDPITVQWIRNFISRRSIRVRSGLSISESHMLSSGVPQGSHLGPLLFNLAIDSISNVVKSSCLTLFADDANLLRVSTRNEDLLAHVSALQDDLDCCKHW